ncbi:oxygen-insensitive NADPH nitroreductase [Shewanella marinintestina]|uniref:oxygen-insensitive NADPH nitroreductase n=1 Tax=Shewanella marinintestina TaxID=190305 RepID=UPI00200E7D8B|nr:oxygen-insensitive NADPH nitroreductase [Shewanella marinintestina]MCL1145397.1 oxygen-insensitive NADPH nitroreductase [Shewanella marinintestina]
MNQTIETILQHRSIRHFTEQTIEADKLDLILQCANAASSSSFIQCTSVIRITNQDKRSKIAELAGGQSYVETAAEFLVFCADFNRHLQVSPNAQLGFTEQTLIGAIDTGLMGQNALLAAESMGLGGVYIGGIRNDPYKVTQLLDLPQYVVPLFGMCIGYPAKVPEKKPRLPLSIVVHQECYQVIDRNELAQYDQHIRDYYAARSSNNKQISWSEQVSATLDKESRPFMQAFLESQGLSTR